MGKVKAWAMEEQFCVVCSQGFWPMEAEHEIDLGAPTCSKACSNEYHGVMNAIADMQEGYTEYCEHCDSIKSRNPSTSGN